MLEIFERLKNIILVTAILVCGVTRFSFADSKAFQWVELVKACEAVILEQSITPLKGYEPAPSSYGLPSIFVYEFYNAKQNLIASAKRVKGEWTQCVVRETAQSRSLWRESSKKWNTVFPSAFPKPAYLWIVWRHRPHRPFPGALRCVEDNSHLVIVPHLDNDFNFIVEVNNQESTAHSKNKVKSTAHSKRCSE